MASYNERYVAFIDILGFRDHVKSLDQEPEKLDRLLDILKEMATEYPQLSRSMSATEGFEQMLRVTTFSDNIVISGELNPIGLGLVLTVSASLCLRLLTQGVLARGGITQGKLFHSESIVIGDGLIKAYELESKTAIYPRIILDPSLAGWTQNMSASFSSPSIWKTTQDFDGLYFLDYLELASLPIYTKSQEDHFLAFVRQEIITTLSGKGDLGVKAKAGWMARYLNDHAEKLQIEPIPLL